MEKVLETKREIWTYQDYLGLPNDGHVYQIIEGELYMVPAPTTYHQDILRDLGFIIWDYVRKIKWGKIYYAPTDVVFSSTEIVQPDIIGIAKGRLSIVKENGVFGAPDLIIEIISPSTMAIDVKLKKLLYQRCGVREYLLVYPEEKKIEAYLLIEGRYHLRGSYLRSDVLELTSIPGLKLDLEEVF